MLLWQSSSSWRREHAPSIIFHGRGGQHRQLLKGMRIAAWQSLFFPRCREHAPSIIFMDEVDSIGSARTDSGGGGGDSEVQRTMLELLKPAGRL